MTSLASCLLAGSWPWSAAAFLVALVALASAVSRHVTLAARSDGDDQERASAVARRTELRAAFASGGRTLAAVAGAILVAWLALASSPSARAQAWAFAIGVVVAAAAFYAAAALEHSARTRCAVAARDSATSAAEVAWEGGLAATFAVGAAQGLATWIVGMTAVDGAPLGLAAGTLLVAWFAQSGRAFAPAAARCVALLSVQTFALAAAVSASLRVTGADARPDLLHLPRLLVAFGALAPLALRGFAGSTPARPLARRLLAPLTALFAAGVVGGLFVGPVAAFAEAPVVGIGAIAVVLLCGVALVAVVARVAEHAALARSDEAGTAVAGDAIAALTPSLFVPCLVLAAAVVVAVSAGGVWGIGLAAAAAAAALPACVAAGFAADVLPRPPVGPTERGSDAERGASSAAVALAGWATLAVARGPGARLDLLSADVTGGAIVGVAVVLLAAAVWRRGGLAGKTNSTRADLRAMIAPALLAVAATFCVARLNPAAGGGMTAGALLGGATAAFLVSRSTAVLFDRVVSLVCITYVLCSR